MHLCIFSDTVTTNVTGITLKDGCLPSIGDYVHSSADVHLDPAVWLKVQVLDVVSVDCSRRQLSWEVSSPQEDDDLAVSRKVEDGEDSAPRSADAGVQISVCAEEFLDLDELFDSLPVFVVRYQKNEMTKSQFSEAIVKLLHLYILPNVYLSSAHVPTLRNALKNQLSALQSINDEIDRSSQKFEAVRQAKRKLRQKFVSELTDDDELVFAGPVMTQLAADIDDDIREISGTLEVAQDVVNRNKRGGGGDGDSDAQWEMVRLAEARSSRDVVMRSYETMLGARENILQRKSLMNSSATPRRRRTQDLKLRDQPEHRIYAELTLFQKDLVSTMRSLTEKKIMAASVREYIRRTLDELERGGESSFGEEVVGGGGIVNGGSDDVDRASKSWMTLAEQVRWLLSSPGHPVKAMHDRFCACVIARCRAAFSERLMYVTSFGDEGEATTPSGPSTPTPKLQETGIFRSEQGPCFPDGAGDCSPDAVKIVVPCSGGQTPLASSSSPSSPTTNRRSRRGIFARMTARKKEVAVVKSPSSPHPDETVDSRAGSPSSSTTLYLLDSSFDDAVMVFNEDTDYAKRAIESLKRDIAVHFETVTELIRAELKQKSKTSIWLSYESLFYDETMEDILTLYGLEYSAVTRMLGQSIRQLTVGDLKFEDSILVNMLDGDADDDDGGTSLEIGLVTGEKTPPDVIQPQNGTAQDHDGIKTGCLRTRSASESDFLDKFSYVFDSDVDVDELIPRLSFIMSKDVNKDEVTKQSKSPSERSDGCKLRRKSFTPTTVRKSIKVNHVLNTSIVYDRTIYGSSQPSDPAKNNAVESSSSPSRKSGFFSVKKKKPPRRDGGGGGGGGGSSGGGGKDSDRKTLARTMTLRPELKSHFRSAFRCLSVAVETRRLSAKFQQLTRCLREVSDQISAFCHRLKGCRGAKETGCDELMDGLIVLLSNLDESLLSQLYIQIVMLIDLMPPFFTCNSFNFALVQFFIAFQFLKEQILLKRSRPSGGNNDTSRHE